MRLLKYLCIPALSFSMLSSSEYIEDIKDAKAGECYKKVSLPAKYETKDEMIEIEKPSKKIVIKEPEFKKIKKRVVVAPAFVDIKDSVATFKKKKILLPKNDKKIYYTIGKNRRVPMSKDFVKYIERKGVDLNNLKVGECYVEYMKIPKKKVIKREYVKKQAYEILDVEPAKFKVVKKKILVKPAYTKIVETNPVYETKVMKVLVTPEKKEFITKKDGRVCVVIKPAVYKTVVKKVLLTPPLTKVIKFPPSYKEVEVKVLKTPPKVSRRVIPQKRDVYDFYLDREEGKYFWLKEDVKSDANKTGLKICKKESKVDFIEREVEIVDKPATTKKVEVKAKTIEIEVEKLVSDANITEIPLPAQYEKVHSKVLIQPAKILWQRVKCKKDNKTKSVH